MVWLLFFVIFTLLVQWWLKNKTTKQLTCYMKIAILTSLTVWFALEVNLTLKDLWGRYRPYELTSGNHEFTNWLTINGVNGHKSFPSGQWFVSNNKRKGFFIGGIVYGVVIAISRVIVGAHFFSDVTFSFFLTALIIFIMNGLGKN
jgi:membrane-associated phospholipid phosphatase